MWRKQSFNQHTGTLTTAAPSESDWLRTQVDDGETRRRVMRQRIIASVSVLSGLAMIVLVASIQRDPLTWTRAARQPQSASTPTVPSLKAETPTEQPPSSATSNGIVEVPPIRITSSKPAAQPEKKRESGALEPCSDWRELGPTYVQEGKPQGTRRVRSLC